MAKEAKASMTQPADIAPLTFSSRYDWRAWLESNERLANEVWLTIRKRRADAAGLLYEEAVEEAVCFGWIDGKMRSISREVYILRFTPRKGAVSGPS